MPWHDRVSLHLLAWLTGHDLLFAGCRAGLIPRRLVHVWTVIASAFQRQYLMAICNWKIGGVAVRRASKYFNIILQSIA
jgi:hypothetical protein